MITKIEDTLVSLRSTAAILRRYTLIPEEQQTVFEDEYNALYVAQKLKDIAGLVREVNTFLADTLPRPQLPLSPQPSVQDQVLNTPVKSKRLLVCPRAPLKKRLRTGLVSSLARAYVEYKQQDDERL